MNQPKLTIGRTGITKPPKICIYAKEGAGKSTFAKSAPKPIYLSTEDRLSHLSVDAIEFASNRFYANTYDEVIAGLKFLARDPHDYKTAVIDTGDGIQQLLYNKIVKDHNAKDMQDMKIFAFQRGYDIARDKWAEEVMPLIQEINERRKMWVILLCHSQQEMINPPDKESYTVYGMALHPKKIQPQIRYAFDIIGFVEDKVVLTEDGKARATGERIMRLKANMPWYLAKDSYGMPDTIPFRKDDSWKVFSETLMPLLKRKDNDKPNDRVDRRSESHNKRDAGGNNEASGITGAYGTSLLQGERNLESAKQNHQEAKEKREEKRKEEIAIEVSKVEFETTNKGEL